MSRYRFELATAADDEDLRRVIAGTAMPGRIQVAFRREPSFFGAAVVEGHETLVVAARDLASGRIVGFGCRSLRDVFVGGQPRKVGYLSGLRLLEEHRRWGLVARGYGFFRRLHAEGTTRLYLTTIAEDNRAARRVLLGGRAGLPVYHDLGRYLTAVLEVRRAHGERMPLAQRDDVRAAANDKLGELLAFWQRHGPRRQFFPNYRADDFCDGGLLRGLAVEHVLVARSGGEIVGTLGVWDQRPFRQVVVAGYDRVYRCLRPWYNAWAPIAGRPRLPPQGSTVDCASAALAVVADDRADVFTSLVDRAADLAAERGVARLMIGLHESDALLPVVRRYRPRWYATRLYAACWDDGEADVAALDGRAPYMELGSL